MSGGVNVKRSERAGWGRKLKTRLDALRYWMRVAWAQARANLVVGRWVYPAMISRPLSFLKEAVLLIIALTGVTIGIGWRPAFLSGLSPLGRAAVIIIPIVLLFIAAGRGLFSKKQLFRLATWRLSSWTVPTDSPARRDNKEAEILAKQLSYGKHQKHTYAFLDQLWRPYVEQTPGLSMLTYPGFKDPLPMVVVNLGELPHNTTGMMNSLLKVSLRSRFRDYSQSMDSGDTDDGPVEPFIIREPGPRHLSRLRGPDPKNTGFEDDYTGHNVCLQSAKLINGVLQLPMHCTAELYGNIMDSSDAMIDELYLHFAIDRDKRLAPPEQVLNHLPWRKSLHRQYDDPVKILMDVRGRAAGVGVAALTVINEKGTYKAIRGTRSSLVGVYPNSYHVIPSGMTNVSKEDCDSDGTLLPNGCYNVKMAIEKEFLEEIFSKDWASSTLTGLKNLAEKVDFYAARHLYGPGNEFEAELHLTGVVFDLLNYRPEVCLLILIKNEKWWEVHDPDTNPDPKAAWKLSYEWKEKVSLIDIYDEPHVRSAMLPSGSVLSGSAAFYLGVQKARAILDGR